MKLWCYLSLAYMLCLSIPLKCENVFAISKKEKIDLSVKEKGEDYRSVGQSVEAWLEDSILTVSFLLEPNEVSVRIFDGDGVIVYKNIYMYSQQIDLNLEQLCGIYIIEIDDDKCIWYGKLNLRNE